MGPFIFCSPRQITLLLPLGIVVSWQLNYIHEVTKNVCIELHIPVFHSTTPLFHYTDYQGIHVNLLTIETMWSSRLLYCYHKATGLADSY